MQKLVYFFQSASAGGTILILFSLMGVILANSAVAESYFSFLQYNIGGLSVLLWINDALMAIFFLYVGIEVKRELLVGQLNTNRKRILPGLAALAGFLVPALIYYALVYKTPSYVSGWAIPTATDIAFALGVFTLLASRVPKSLKAFLTALAVIDDLMAIVVIALFYTSSISAIYLFGALFVLLLLIICNRRVIIHPLPYICLGIILWLCVLKSGLHATLAGVALAFTIPFEKVRNGETAYPCIEWEHALSPWVTFGIIPIFGFANAGVSFATVTFTDLFNPVVVASAVALFVGKQIGVFGLVYTLVKTGIVPMPLGANWRHIYGVAVLCGIGFTMSLFIAMLAFSGSALLLDYAKIGVFIGSIASAILGAIILRLGKIEEPRES